MNKKILLLGLTLTTAFAVQTNAVTLLSLDFETVSSLDSWNPVGNATPSDKAWLETGGTLGTGAIQLSGTNPGPGGAAFIFQNITNGFDFQGFDEITLSFDIKLTTPLNGAAIHLETNTMGPAGANNPNNFFDLQNFGVNADNYTNITRTISNVPSNADTLFLSFNLAAGAFAGAGGGFAIDNLSITAVPEPSTYAAILGLFCIGWLSIRKRLRKA